MRKFMQVVSRFVRDEEAATAAEYGIIAALVGGALLFATKVFGDALKNLFGQLSTKLNIN